MDIANILDIALLPGFVENPAALVIVPVKLEDRARQEFLPAFVIFTFNGKQSRCYGCISKQLGSCDVFIDDEFIEKADCCFGADIPKTVFYQSPILPYGSFKLELRVTGEHFKNANEDPVSVDAFSYKK
jgi:hypothetical protein